MQPHRLGPIVESGGEGMAGHDRSEEPLDRTSSVGTLANRVAILTFVTAFAFIVGLVAAPHALDGDVGVPARVAAALPLLFAGVAAAWTRRARTRLRNAGGGGPAGSAKPSRAGAERRAEPTRELARETHATRTRRT